MMGCINPGRETPWQVELEFLRAGSAPQPLFSDCGVNYLAAICLLIDI
jgi:hypothetical protein